MCRSILRCGRRTGAVCRQRGVRGGTPLYNTLIAVQVAHELVSGIFTMYFSVFLPNIK